jgi:hypothetical protein
MPQTPKARLARCGIVAGDGAWRSLVSALVWGTRGPRFKSGRPDSKALVSGAFAATQR